MLYRISVAERGLTGIANIFRSRLSGLDDLLQAGTVPLTPSHTCYFSLLECNARGMLSRPGHFHPLDGADICDYWAIPA